jgi:hypothetical protein
VGTFSDYSKIEFAMPKESTGVNGSIANPQKCKEDAIRLSSEKVMFQNAG